MKYAPSFHRTNGFRPVLLILTVLALLPFFVTETYARHILILIFVFAILASNWDVSLGLGGIFNFAHLGFFAIGLYTYAILAKVVGVNPWLALAVSPLPAMAFATILAIPILRLEGVYVILVTIAATQLLSQIIVSQSDYTGGTSGMVLLPRLEIAGYKLSKDGRIGYYYLALVLLIASTTFLYKLERSAIGRAIKAMRDNKYYAISRGASEARTRLMTLVLSAIFPALAGAYYGAYLRVASPEVFGLGFLTLSLSILLLGGAATIWGPLIAAFVVVGLNQSMADYGAWRNIIIACAIIVVVAVYPGGLFAILQEAWSAVDRAKTAFIAFWRRRFQAPIRARAMGTADQLVETRHGLVSVCDTNGKGPALIFVHGNSSCKEVFTHQFAAFRDRYRCIAFDLPGHGVSPNAHPETAYNVSAYAEALSDIVQRLKLDRPIVFGWSLGGYVALEFAAMGGSCAGVAICGTSPIAAYPRDMARGYQTTPHMELAGKRFHSPAEKANYARHTLGSALDDNPLPRQAVWRTDGKARQHMIAHLRTINWRRQMDMIANQSVPFTMINGAQDPFIDADYCAAVYPKTVALSNLGHAPFLENPDVFQRAFRKWLDQPTV